MVELKGQQLVSKIGVSVYSAQQIDQLMDKFAIDLVQIPINVLDQRLLASGHLNKLKQQNIEIHSRSVFLQGLLLMGMDEIPSYFLAFKSHLDKWQQLIQSHDITPLQGALSFALSIPEIDKVVVGVNNVSQLIEIVAACNTYIDATQFEGIASMDTNLINPSNWKL